MTAALAVTKEHGLHGTPYDVDSNTNSDNSNTNLNWAGIPDTLDNLTVAQVYKAIKDCFRHALNSDTYAKQTRQDMVMSGTDTAAYAHEGLMPYASIGLLSSDNQQRRRDQCKISTRDSRPWGAWGEELAIEGSFFCQPPTW